MQEQEVDFVERMGNKIVNAELEALLNDKNQIMKAPFEGITRESSDKEVREFLKNKSLEIQY